MNREAVALGTPVYTMFEGRLGAVDEGLIAEGRLRRLELARGRELVKRDPARAAARAVRRDPRDFTALLTSPVDGVPPGAAVTARSRGGRSPRIHRMRRRMTSAALPVHRHSIPQLVVDGLLVALAYYLAYRLRFDRGIPPRYEDLFTATILPVVGVSVVVFALFGLYRKWWRYFGQRDYEIVVRGVVLATLALVGYIALVKPGHRRRPGPGRSPRSARRPASSSSSSCCSSASSAASASPCSAILERPVARLPAAARTRATSSIVGAGDGGRWCCARSCATRTSATGRSASSTTIRASAGCASTTGSRCSARRRTSPRILDEVEPDEVIIAIPSAPGTLRGRVVAACRERGIPVRTLPTVFELLQGGVNVMRQVREVKVEDVLGREPVRMELERVGAYLTGQVVMVTGAGGSIGSELCRQIARVGPRRLVLRRPRRGQPLRDPPRAGGGPPRARRGPRAGRLQGGGAHARGVRRAPPRRRLPRGRLQARRADGGSTRSRPCATTRSPRGSWRASPATAGVSAFVLVSTDKAVTPDDGDGRLEGARRVGGRGGRCAAPGHALRDRAVRQRARLVGLGGADLPPPDRGRRPGHGHRPGDDALLHDDPGGRAAHHPGRARSARAARSSCSRWASRCGSSTSPTT